MDARTRLATLLSVSALALATLTACGSSDPTETSSGTSPSHASDPAGSGADPSDGATPTDGGSSAAETTVPVYFVGDTPDGPRLYREFRSVSGDPLTGALALMTSGDAQDPDYRTLFPSGEFASAEAATDKIVVTLPDDSWTTMGDLTQREARLAAQQLVYTAQGVAQERVPVEVQLDGQPADLFGLAGELSNEDEIDVRALVNVTSPAEGASVTGTFTASGVSSSFEATTPWEIRQGGPDGRVVKKGFATAEGWMDKLYPWSTEVDVTDLAPGAYTFVAMTDDPSGGEGPGPTVDTKAITVG